MDAPCAVVAFEKRRDLRCEEPLPHPVLREHHRGLHALGREHRRHLHRDEAAADRHRAFRSCVRVADGVRVLDRAKVADGLAVSARHIEIAGARARGDDQLLVHERPTTGEVQCARIEVDTLHARIEHRRDAVLAIERLVADENV